MIGTLRKHSTWLWVLLIAAMSIGLVAVFQPGSGQLFNSQGGTIRLGSIDGRRISAKQFGEAQNEVRLGYLLRYGRMPEKLSPEELNNETYKRLLFIKLLNQHDVDVDTASVAGEINAIRRELGGKGNPVPFEALVRFLNQNRLSFGDLERYVRHNLGIRQLASVVSVGATLVSPREGSYLYQHDYQRYATKAVFFSATNYLAHVTNVTPSAVAEFYTNNMAAYRIPERVQVSYVSFSISNYLAQAKAQFTNINEAVEDVFQRMGTNYTHFGNTPAEAKVAIRKELIHNQAAVDAQKKATDFESKLFDMEPVSPENLATLARTNGLAIRVTLPFTKEQGPVEFDGGPDFAKEAFALSPDSPFPDLPIKGENAVYVIAYQKNYPEEIPPLSRIRARVTADYELWQATLLARQAGEKFQDMATNRMVRGENFDKICSEAGIKPVSIPLFNLNTRDLPEVEEHASLGQFEQLASRTPTGSISAFALSRQGGYVLYVERRVPVSLSQMQAELPRFMTLLRSAREQEALNMWFSREAASSLRLYRNPEQQKTPPAAQQ